MTIKVCGMRDAENIRAVEALGIDWMGFIFYEKSSRYVGSEPPAYLPVSCSRVGVFVNPELEQVLEMTGRFGLSRIQLHGSESPEFCRSLAEALPSVELIKAFSVASEADLERTGEYDGIVLCFLFDTATKGYGGSGKTFDWSVLNNYRGNTSFMLSGGIGPGSIEALSRFHHPRWQGIDLNSCFELAPGMKDQEALREFIHSFKKLQIK